MNSVSREKKILELLQQQGSASIRQLAEFFGVSAMTIHRDLDKLEHAGALKKKHGGAILAAQAGENVCAMCNKTTQDRFAFLIRLSNGRQIRTCCPHCGLMLKSQKKNLQGLAADFLRGQMVSANHAVYLIGSEVNVCCVPSVLCFVSSRDAEKFKKGFGGKTASMQEAIEYLHQLMRV